MHRHICHRLVTSVRLRLIQTGIGDDGLVQLAGIATTLPKVEDRIAEAEPEVRLKAILDPLFEGVPEGA